MQHQLHITEEGAAKVALVNTYETHLAIALGVVLGNGMTICAIALAIRLAASSWGL